jgi:hypothetical protein
MDPAGSEFCRSNRHWDCADADVHQRPNGNTLPHADVKPPQKTKGRQWGPPKEQYGWRRLVRNFTPSWFSVNMGTGIVSILLHNLPYNAVWLYWISVVVFGLNVFLFVAFLCVSILRYAIWPEIWMKMIRHPAQSLFLGTFPMGLATIVNMVVFVCVPAWGPWAVTLVILPTPRLLLNRS